MSSTGEGRPGPPPAGAPPLPPGGPQPGPGGPPPQHPPVHEKTAVLNLPQLGVTATPPPAQPAPAAPQPVAWQQQASPPPQQWGQQPAAPPQQWEQQPAAPPQQWGQQAVAPPPWGQQQGQPPWGQQSGQPSHPSALVAPRRRNPALRIILGFLLLLLGVAFAATVLEYWTGNAILQETLIFEVQDLLDEGPTWLGLVAGHAIPALAILGGVLVMAGKRVGSWLALAGFLGAAVFLVLEVLDDNDIRLVTVALTAAGIVIALVPWTRR